MRSIDIHEGTAADICLTGSAEDVVQVTRTDGDRSISSCVTSIAAAIDIAAYDYLRLPRHSGQQQHHTDDGLFNSQCLILNA